MSFMLIDKGANVNTQDIYGKTPLLYAIFLSIKVFDRLIKHPEINIEISDEDGYTPLILSCIKNIKGSKTTKILLEKGASIDVLDKSNHLLYIMQ